jgi:hypothetical protein
VAKAKWGAGALGAFVRQGAKEFAQIIPAFKDSIQVVEEPGAPLNLTPVEVYKGKLAEEVQGKETKKALEMEMGQ